MVGFSGQSAARTRDPNGDLSEREAEMVDRFEKCMKAVKHYFSEESQLFSSGTRCMRLAGQYSLLRDPVSEYAGQ